jgi:hypothetical protein
VDLAVLGLKDRPFEIEVEMPGHRIEKYRHPEVGHPLRDHE